MISYVINVIKRSFWTILYEEFLPYIELHAEVDIISIALKLDQMLHKESLEPSLEDLHI